MRIKVALLAATAASLFLISCGDGDGTPLPGAETTPTAEDRPTVTDDSTQDGGGSDDEDEAQTTPDADSDSPATGSDPGAADFAASLDGWIIFSSERDSEEGGTRDDLYIARPDGSDVQRLTATEHNAWWPSVAPDGESLLYGRNYPGEPGDAPSGHARWGVVWLERDGTATELTSGNHFESRARWSPDGSKILFTSSRGSRASFVDGLYTLGETNVWVMDADGSNQVQLTEGGATAGGWSPDGSQIVFTATPEGKETSDLFIMDADGSNVRQLTDDEFTNARADWSPDGTRIVFDSVRDGDDSEIFVINIDGSNLVQLTDNDARDSFAVWSPDGEAIAFTTARDGNVEVYVMAPDGSNQFNVSQNPALDTLPGWSHVAFTVD